MAALQKRALPFILPCGKFRLGCILTVRLLRNMHRNLFRPLSAGIQRVVRAVPIQPTAFSAGATTATACELEWRKSIQGRKMMQIKAVPYNTERLGYGLVAILFPPPPKQHDNTIAGGIS